MHFPWVRQASLAGSTHRYQHCALRCSAIVTVRSVPAYTGGKEQTFSHSHNVHADACQEMQATLVCSQSTDRTLANRYTIISSILLGRCLARCRLSQVKRIVVTSLAISSVLVMASLFELEQPPLHLEHRYSNTKLVTMYLCDLIRPASLVRHSVQLLAACCVAICVNCG